jgi:hypothetical protein
MNPLFDVGKELPSSMLDTRMLLPRRKLRTKSPRLARKTRKERTNHLTTLP